jgi:4'-phosphopantetheinyl transferase
MNAAPPPQRHRVFLQIWTCKEAALKAAGTGLAIPLDQVQVPLSPQECTAVIAAPEGRSPGAGWSIRRLFLEDGSVAAVAFSAADWRLQLWR